MRHLAVTTAILLLGLLYTRPADACSPPFCWSNYLVPADGTSIPANTPALYWQPMSSHDYDAEPADPTTLTLVDVDTGTPVPFATVEANGGYVLQLATPLREQAVYQLTDPATCTDGFEPSEPTTHTLHVTASAPLPDSLGTLTATAQGVAPLEVGTAAGSCSTTVDAGTALISLAPSAAAEPWLALLSFETLVDGRRWSAAHSINATYPPGESWLGRGHDQLYTVCATDGDIEPFDGLSEGDHQVVIRATLPGSDLAIETAPVTVTLSCADDTGDDTEDNNASNAAGCAIGPRSGESTLAPLLLGLLLFALRRRGVSNS